MYSIKIHPSFQFSSCLSLHTFLMQEARTCCSPKWLGSHLQSQALLCPPSPHAHEPQMLLGLIQVLHGAAHAHCSEFPSPCDLQSSSHEFILSSGKVLCVLISATSFIFRPTSVSVSPAKPWSNGAGKTTERPGGSSPTPPYLASSPANAHSPKGMFSDNFFCHFYIYFRLNKSVSSLFSCVCCF